MKYYPFKSDSSLIEYMKSLGLSCTVKEDPYIVDERTKTRCVKMTYTATDGRRVFTIDWIFTEFEPWRHFKLQEVREDFARGVEKALHLRR